MTFPVPEQRGSTRRSTAERDRVAALIVAILLLPPVGLLVFGIVGDPWLGLTLTFLGSYLLLYFFVRGLRRRFLRRAVANEWTMTPTARPVPRKAARAVGSLTALGYAVVEVAAVTDTEGIVFTKPLVILHWTAGPITAIAGGHSTQLVTPLSNGQWLVTASTKIVRHQLVVAQTVHKGTPEALVEVHQRGLLELSQCGLGVVGASNPVTNALRVEQFEQETIRQLHEQANLPTATLLLESGDVLTDRNVRNRIARAAENPPLGVGVHEKN